MSIENGMVIGLDKALAEHYRTLDPVALEVAELRVLGDMDSFSDDLNSLCGGWDEAGAGADRALRMPHRLEQSNTAVVMAALLLSAHRNDAEETLRCARLLVQRHLDKHTERIARIAGGEE